MDAIALLSHTSPTATVAYRAGIPVSVRQFLSDARHLAQRLPNSKHILNVCADRYHFTVGLASCLMSQRVSLLPSTHTPQVIAHLSAFAPDAFCLTDNAHCDIELPQFYFPAQMPVADSSELQESFRVPAIAASQLAAIVFTSGSTGVPMPFQKTWGLLARCIQSGAPRLGLVDGRSHAIVGTVPGQHMYGFESTVLLALLNGNAFCAERPFYPADVAAAVEAVPRPRILVTTPIHLRTLLGSNVGFPPVDLVVCATAALSQALAREVEKKYRTPLLEIYGSTETGQIAIRRTADTLAWRLWPGVRLSMSKDQVFAQGGHIEQLTPMCDVIEITGEEEFLLHGRMADLVNVAGKRSSFGYLNAQLNAIPGVRDGAFFMREGPTGSTGIDRLGAVVVAPGMSVATLIEELRQKIDPVFLPRPLLMVQELPRNATGKLPQAALQGFAESQLRADDSP
ncbi:MAG: AMP-binding protein [Pseudomonadota bacterium]|nr:AMP-binding protein [Pseudomonadota bacterium]